MKQRSPIAVFLLPFVTFGIYSIVWQVKTKNEMNNLGATIPTAWLLIVPFVNIYWLWKYSEGVEKVTNAAITGVLAFVLQFLLGSIGSAILQNEFNKPIASAAPGVPGAPMAAFQVDNSPQPDASFGGPVASPATPQLAAPVMPTMSEVITPTPQSDPSNAQPTQ